MKEIKKIEKLLKEKLQNFETPVNPALWEGIKSGIGATGVGGAVATTKIGATLLKSIALIATVALVGTSIYYLTKDTTNTAKTKITPQKTIENNATTHNQPKKQIESKNYLVKNNLTEKDFRKQAQPIDNKKAVPIVNQQDSLEKGMIATQTTQKAPDLKENKVAPPIKNKEVEKTTHKASQTEIIPPKEQIEESENISPKEQAAPPLSSKITPERSFMEKLPNVFTPNGDGENDVLTIKTPALKRFVMVVYNQKGALIFRTTNPEKGWNGIDKFGKMVESGVYIYQISAIGEDGTDYGAKIKQVRVIR